MNAQQAENLRILIRHMETTAVERLHMPLFRHPCGTPACAWGHATTLPQFAGAQDEMIGVSIGRYFGLPPTTSDWRKGWGRLFGTALMVNQGDSASPRYVESPTPKEWAAEARKVLAEHGYSMDDNKTWADGKLTDLLRVCRTEILPLDERAFGD